MPEKSLFDYLKAGASTVGEYGSRLGGAGMDLAQSPIGMIAIMAMLTDYINKQQNKNFGTDPYGGAIRDIKGQRDKYSNLFTQAAAGQTTNPQVALMRNMLQNRATTPPLTAPTVKPPVRFNPYAEGGVGAGGADADLMSNIKSLAMGQGANYQSGMGALQESLANRFGIRAMREGNLAGKLTPYGQTPSVIPPVTSPVTESYPFNPERPGLPFGAVEPTKPVTPLAPYPFNPERPGIPIGAVEPTRPVAEPAPGSGAWLTQQGIKQPTSQLRLPGSLPPELLEMLKLLMVNMSNKPTTQPAPGSGAWLAQQRII